MTARMPVQPQKRWLLEVLAAALGALLLGSVALAADPLYQQEPFDRITLDAANKNLVLKVEPLDFPSRRVPENRPRSSLCDWSTSPTRPTKSNGRPSPAGAL